MSIMQLDPTTDEMIEQVFSSYLALFGKSYKSKETYEQRKQEFMKTQ